MIFAAIALLLFYSLYAILLPLIRKRPVVLTTVPFVIILLLTAVVSESVIVSAVVGIIALFFLTARAWLVIGIQEADFRAAADRTIKGILTQAELDISGQSIRFTEPAGRINIYKILTVRVITFRVPETKKTILFREVLKKMIDNYFFHI